MWWLHQDTCAHVPCFPHTGHLSMCPTSVTHVYSVRAYTRPVCGTSVCTWPQTNAPGAPLLARAHAPCDHVCVAHDTLTVSACVTRVGSHGKWQVSVTLVSATLVFATLCVCVCHSPPHSPPLPPSPKPFSPSSPFPLVSLVPLSSLSPFPSPSLGMRGSSHMRDQVGMGQNAGGSMLEGSMLGGSMSRTACVG